MGILSRRVNTPGILCGAVAAIFLSLGFNGLPPLVQPFLNKAALFEVEPGIREDLDAGVISTRLERAFKTHGIAVSSDAAMEIQEKGSQWRIRSGEIFYSLERARGRVTVSHEPINWMWVPVLSMALNLLIGYLASFLFKPPPETRLAGLTWRA